MKDINDVVEHLEKANTAVVNVKNWVDTHFDEIEEVTGNINDILTDWVINTVDPEDIGIDPDDPSYLEALNEIVQQVVNKLYVF